MWSVGPCEIFFAATGFAAAVPTLVLPDFGSHLVHVRCALWALTAVASGRMGMVAFRICWPGARRGRTHKDGRKRFISTESYQYLAAVLALRLK